MIDKIVLHKLNIKYASEGLDLMKAVRTWNELKFNPERIREQIRNDVKANITEETAEELYHMGSSMKCDYDSINKPFTVSKGRENLIPDNIKNKSVKLSPSIKMSMERVGQNLYRDKKAKTYWTMKEKIADNGDKMIYLVAIEEQEDDTKKTAEFLGGKPSNEMGTETSVVNIKAVGENPTPMGAPEEGQEAKDTSEEGMSQVKNY